MTDKLKAGLLDLLKSLKTTSPEYKKELNKAIALLSRDDYRVETDNKPYEEAEGKVCSLLILLEKTMPALARDNQTMITQFVNDYKLNQPTAPSTRQSPGSKA